MANETKQIKTIGTVRGVPASPKASRIRTAIKRAGRFFASALLVSGLMLASQEARAEETKAPEKVGVGLKVGAGYQPLENEPRAIVSISAAVPLPLKASLSGALGVSSTMDGSAQWEETKLSLGIPIAGPVFVDLYGYNSKHMFIPTLSAGADIGAGFKWGAIIAGYEHLFDFDSDLAFGVIAVNAIPEILSLTVSGSHAWTTKSGSFGAGLGLTPGGWAPELGVHVFGLFDKKSVFALDTIATLGYSF